VHLFVYWRCRQYILKTLVPVAVAPARPRCFPKEPIWGSKRAYFAFQKSLFRIPFKPILEAERAYLGKVKGKKVTV